MFQQFFGKPFWLMMAGIVGTFLTSIFVFNSTSFSVAALVVFGLAAFALSLYRLEWGMLAAFVEVFASSNGHWIQASLFGISVSLREVIFLGVMAAWLICLVLRRVPAPWRDARLSPFYLLAAAVGIGFAVGFANHSPLVAFQDGNAYLFALYILPVLSIDWTAAAQRRLLQALAVGAVFVAGLTLGLTYLFTHLPAVALSPIYTFMRNTRTAELTDMHGIFRVFLQAQFSVIVLLLLCSMTPWLMRLRGKAFWIWTASLAVLWSAVIIGLSRSFWVGIAAGFVAVMALLIHQKNIDKPRWFAALGGQALAIIFSLVLLAGIIFVPPHFKAVGSFSDLLSARTTDITDVAVSSRWNLLPQMMRQIVVSPIIGNGFGQTITFKTDDPRVRAFSPDGTWTTYSFEWGWLELWLKMGVLGPLAFLVLFAASVKGLQPLFKTDRAWLGLGLIASLVMLYVTQISSPYLNHPLGLGLLMFVVPFFPVMERVAVTESVRVTSSVQPVSAVLAADIE